jgi:hypothetical protein
VFYERDRHRCAVHAHAGPETLPVACRNFPRVALRDGRGVFITLSHFCPTAAALLVEDRDITIEEAPSSLSLNGAVDGLDATAVLPPLLRPGLLTDADGYTAWETEAVSAFNDRRLSAPQALAIIAAATDDVCRWQPGPETLADRARGAFGRARSGRDDLATHRSPLEHAIKSFLAAHLFASWCAYQEGGLGAIVRSVERAYATLEEELSTAPFIAAVRAADFRLRHCRADVRPRSLSSLRRH